MPTETGAHITAATLALNTYTACLTANQTPLAISEGDTSNTPKAGTAALAIRALTAAGVIDGPITPVPLLPGHVPAVYLVLPAWQPGKQTPAQLQSSLAKALAENSF